MNDAPKGPAPSEWFQGEMALAYADRGPRRFIPGYDASHVMVAVLLRERLADDAEILVVGAGGGLSWRSSRGNAQRGGSRALIRPPTC